MHKVSFDIEDKISGTIARSSKDNPSVILLTAKGYITPSNETDFTNLMDSIKRSIRVEIASVIGGIESISNKFLFNISVASEKMEVGKSSFYESELYVKLKDASYDSSDELKVLCEFVMRQTLQIMSKHSIDIRAKK